MKKLLLPILSAFAVTSFGTLPCNGAPSEAISGAFSAAKDAFGKGENAAAAASMRTGAGLVSAEVEGQEGARNVQQEARELVSLSGNVEKGEIKNPATLDSAFASTHNALAAYYNARAERLLAAGSNKEAGESMEMEANNLELSARWAGHTFTEEGRKSVGLLRTVGGTLVSGAGSGVEVVGSVLKGGLGIITKIGSKIKGDKALSDEKVTDKTAAAAGGVVEGTGKVAEVPGGAVEKTGGAIKKIGDAIKGEPKTEEAPKGE